MGMFDSLKNVFGSKPEETQDVTVSPSKMLRDAGIDPDGIKFGFGSDGSISMSGEITEESQREQIVAILSAAPGINRVDDNTTVAPPTPVEPDAVENGAPAAVEPQTPAAEAAPEKESGKTYTVESGDTLWKISEEVYGNGSKYMKIFEANTDLLDSPDRIFPGQKLVIPELE